MSDFRKVQSVDEPELVAARWWAQRDPSEGPSLSRRSALLGLAGITAVGALSQQGCSGSTSADLGPVGQESLALQKEAGWDFGADGKVLDMGPDAGPPVDPYVLKDLSTRLTPTNPANRPFARLVLFDSVRQATAATTDLGSALRPIHSPAMDNAELAGRGLSTLFEGAPAGKVVLVDLPGPESVAFAAGLANRFDPVFVFDNWPHPRGTVPTHLTLAAAVDRLATFEELAPTRSATAPPAFVLDSNRLNTFAESEFDNRYVAYVPSAEAMKKLGVTGVVLVRPKGGDRELDDLNASVLEWKEAGIDVQLVGLDSFQPVPEGESAVEYGPEVPPTETTASTTDHYATTHHYTHHHHYGGYGSHWLLWSHYGWGSPRYGYRPSSYVHSSYTPSRRATSFGKTARPAGFGQMSVDRSTGRPSLSRTQSKSSGSWGRARSGGYS
ncbi:MAG: hypothetical protein H6737_31000 [Alphaproteobacteria bacterium]|nr:hypothetical protein [Alphaproteobacteria bacterium]